MGVLLAVFDILLIIGSLALSTAWSRRSPRMNPIVSLAFGGQALLLLVAGAIFLIQGWRLDPLLAFAAFLLHIIVLASLLKDWVILTVVGDR
ncbi:MAG: hypothetical protein VKL39_12210 [Leptolyngbyaceae bacterium]|nr:hypothetical protein [Leptolyngbyaceae bacterium]